MAMYKQDDILTLDVVAYGMEGEGIAKENGYTFFIPFAIKGEKVKVKVIHVNKKNLVFCELKEILESSEMRVKPECNRFMRCGGCDMAHIKYEEQLKIKRDNIINLFRKNAGMDVKVDETVPCTTPYGYRNKIQIPFGTVNGEVAMGFFRENSHKIVSVTKCFLHGDWAEKFIKLFIAFAKDKKLTAYDDVKKKGLLRHLVVRKIGDEYCVVVVTNGEKLPHVKELTARLDEVFGDNYALYNSVKKEHNNVIMGENIVPVKEKRIEADILGIKSEINPYSFLQLNDEIRDKIYSRIIEEIGEGEKTVIDAYAGVGALGAVLAKNGATVYNVEIVKEATLDGEKLALKNGLQDKITNVNGDAAEVVPAIISKLTESDNGIKDTQKPIYIILDPPRKGCEKRVLDSISEIKASHKIYYISCNPATLTRDVKILADAGYEVNYVTPYDMFPNTKHVETVVCLSLRDKRSDINS